MRCRPLFGGLSPQAVADDPEEVECGRVAAVPGGLARRPDQADDGGRRDVCTDCPNALGPAQQDPDRLAQLFLDRGGRLIEVESCTHDGDDQVALGLSEFDEMLEEAEECSSGVIGVGLTRASSVRARNRSRRIASQSFSLVGKCR